jgi:hypothetical protein
MDSSNQADIVVDQADMVADLFERIRLIIGDAKVDLDEPIVGDVDI